MTGSIPGAMWPALVAIFMYAASAAAVTAPTALCSVARVQPSTALPGQTLTLQGSGFNSSMKIFLGDLECTSVAVQSISQATCVVPSYVGEREAQVFVALDGVAMSSCYCATIDLAVLDGNQMTAFFDFNTAGLDSSRLQAAISAATNVQLNSISISNVDYEQNAVKFQGLKRQSSTANFNFTSAVPVGMGIRSVQDAEGKELLVFPGAAFPSHGVALLAIMMSVLLCAAAGVLQCFFTNVGRMQDMEEAKAKSEQKQQPTPAQMQVRDAPAAATQVGAGQNVGPHPSTTGEQAVAQVGQDGDSAFSESGEEYDDSDVVEEDDSGKP